MVLPLLGDRAGDVTAHSTAVPPIRGVVDFGQGADRQVAAGMGDVARGATVSLIDANSYNTLSTSKTSSEGKFELQFSGGFIPKQDAVYILEGVKGLQENRPGNNAARVRTFMQFTAGGWLAITQGGVTINTSTTALTVMQGHYSISGFQGPEAFPLNYIGLIAQTSSSATSPDTLKVGQTLVNGATFVQVQGFVWESIDNDRDPLAVITFSKTTGQFTGPVLDKPSIADVFPTSASTGTEIAIYGVNFTSVQEVTFNGAPTTPKAGSTPTKILVDVPADATSGDLVVRTAKGSSQGIPFSVVPGFPGKFTGTQ